MNGLLSNHIRVATYNIHQCIGRDGVEDSRRTASLIEDLNADFVGIQELGSNKARADVDGSLQLNTIVQQTGMLAVTGPTIRHPNSSYGNCLLTRHQVKSVRRMSIGEPGCEPRGLLDVDLIVEKRLVRVMITHLGLRAWERRRQVKKIVDQLNSIKRDLTLLMGDFNEWCPWSRILRNLKQVFGTVSSPATFPSQYPVLSLDRIWVMPEERVKERMAVKSDTSRRISDHLPLLAEVHLPPV